MENQHRKITGYRELTEDEIALMNEVKAKAAETGALIDRLKYVQSVDPRWTAIASTQLQQGFMALTRAIAKPEFF